MTRVDPVQTAAAPFPVLRYQEGNPYAKHDLLALIGLITTGDKTALEELIECREPLMLDGRRLSLPAWIETMTDRPPAGWSGGDRIPEMARDLCYDRFTRLPPEPDGGTDCRYYYLGFLRNLPDELAVAGQFHPMQRNTQVLQRFGGYVRRHWRLCMRDAWRRQQDLAVAHKFVTPQGSLSLWVPGRIPLQERDDWLERCFGPIDTGAMGATARLQSLIDTWLDQDLRDREKQLRASIDADPFGVHGSGFSIEHGWSSDGLARTVALEKANAPARLRTSIAALGPERIEQLVLGIFEDVIAGRYRPSTTARDFGLHKSTLTRFAAAHWLPSTEGPVPDLWLNTAQVLASQPRFACALEEAGLDDIVSHMTSPPSDHDGTA